MWEIHPVLCTNVTVRGVTIHSLGTNNDGCDPESCRDVLIEDCVFETGDDCIAIKSGRNNDGRRIGVPSENIVIRRCTMQDGHGGVTMGSEISGGVRNVFVSDCTMDSPNLERAFRFKSNAVRGGVIENIFVRDVKIGRVARAVLSVEFDYEEGANGPHKPVLRNVRIESVTSASSGRVAIVTAFPGAVIEGMRLEGLRLPAGSRPPMCSSTPARSRWKTSPSSRRTKTKTIDALSPLLTRRRPLSLGHLRAALLRDDDQLHRPPGLRHPRAGDEEDLRLDRHELHRHRLLVRGRLCHRATAGRAACSTASARSSASRSPCFFGAAPRCSMRRWGASSGFSLARFLLGLGESGNFPACIKTVAEWFPKKERALATGIFNAGSNVGAIAAPLAVPWIYLRWGWQWAFIATGAIGFVWLVFWLRIFRAPEQHPRLSPGELAYIRSDPAEPTAKIPWLRLLPHRQTLAYVLGQVPHRLDLALVSLSAAALLQHATSSSISRASARRSCSSIAWPMSAASPAAGSRRI